MKRTLTITLDVDWLWRKALPWTWERGASASASIADLGHRLQTRITDRSSQRLRSVLGERGSFAATWPIGVTAAWIAVLLVGYVVLYFV